MIARSAALSLTVCAALFLSQHSYAGDVAITVTPSLAPNGFGSPSFDGYVSNALYAIDHGLSSYGDPTKPTYYQVAPSTLKASDVIVTGFNSWMGQANPGAVFGPDFANEYGNRLHFGLHVVGSNGAKFSISQLAFTATSTDPGNTLGFTFGAGSYNYSNAYVGIDYGADGVRGGVDDQFITSGLNTQLVNEIIGRGSGNAWDTYAFSDPVGGSLQDKIDHEVALHGGDPFKVSGTYTLTMSSGLAVTGTSSINGVSGSATVLFNDSPTQPPDTNATPLPTTATTGILLLTIPALIARRRRQPSPL